MVFSIVDGKKIFCPYSIPEGDNVISSILKGERLFALNSFIFSFYCIRSASECSILIDMNAILRGLNIQAQVFRFEGVFGFNSMTVFTDRLKRTFAF